MAYLSHNEIRIMKAVHAHLAKGVAHMDVMELLAAVNRPNNETLHVAADLLRNGMLAAESEHVRNGKYPITFTEVGARVASSLDNVKVPA